MGGANSGSTGLPGNGGSSAMGGTLGSGASAGESALWTLDKLFGCEAVEQENSCFATGFARTAVVPIDASMLGEPTQGPYAFLAARGDKLFVINEQRFNIYDPTTGSWALRSVTIPAQPREGTPQMLALLSTPDGFVAVSREGELGLTWLTKLDEAGDTIGERSLTFTARELFVQPGGEDVVMLAQGVRWVPDGAGGMLGMDDLEAPDQLFRFDQALEQKATVKLPLTQSTRGFLAMSASSQLAAAVDDMALTSVSQTGMIASHAFPQASVIAAAATGVARGEQLLFLLTRQLLVFDPAASSLSLLEFVRDPSLPPYFSENFSVAHEGCHAALGVVGQGGEGVPYGAITLFSGDFETRQHFGPEVDRPHVARVAVSERLAGALFFGANSVAALQVFECAK